jgi:hypothetical protein
VTGAVLILTLTAFGAAGRLRERLAAVWRTRPRAPRAPAADSRLAARR